MPDPLRRRRWLHRLFATLTVLSVLCLTLVGGTYGYVTWRLNQLKVSGDGGGTSALKSRPTPGKPFTVLVIGTDSRTGTGTEYGTNADACHCSDVLILARVDPAAARISLLSVPRDSYVPLQGLNENGKINASFTKGSNNTVDTLQQALGIEVNHYVTVNFAGFKGVVDALGGIRLDFPTPVRDKNAGLDVERTGCQRVDGNTALAVSRSRELQYLQDGSWHDDPTYEYGRSRRQQIFLRVLASAIVKQGLHNPLTANAVIGKFTSHNRLQVDSSVTAQELLTLAGDFASFDPSSIASFTLPTHTKKIPVWGDIEVLEPTADRATITAWYAAAQASAAPAPTAGSTVAPTASPTTSTTASPSASPSTAPTATPTGATPTPSAGPTVEPNQPRFFDPLPCTS